MFIVLRSMFQTKPIQHVYKQMHLPFISGKLSNAGTFSWYTKSLSFLAELNLKMRTTNTDIFFLIMIGFLITNWSTPTHEYINTD